MGNVIISVYTSFYPPKSTFFQLAASFRATPLVASPSIHRPQHPRPRHIDSTVPRTARASRTTERKRRAGHHNTKRPGRNTTTPRRYNATTRHCDNTTCSHRASGTHGSTPQRRAASTPLYYATCIFHWRRGLYILFSSYSLYILYMF